MDQIAFTVISESSGSAYTLIAQPTERGFRFSCSCPAGAIGQFCKHREAIIIGSTRPGPGVAETDLSIFKSWLASSRIDAMRASISAAEDEVKLAKKRVTILKHELGRRLEEGTA